MFQHIRSLRIGLAAMAAICLPQLASAGTTTDDSNWTLSKAEAVAPDDSNWVLPNDQQAALDPSTDSRSLFDDSRFAFDLSTRVTYRNGLDEWAYDQYIGIDFAKTFSSESGDWGKLNAQFYLTRIDNQRRHPYFFEGNDDWELVTRITNFNYTGLADGKFNIRVGHFEIPYGLEVGVNSNGTLRQLLTGPNLGVKADWGVGINGTLPELKYEFTLSRGTGNEYHTSGDPFVLAGRIGTPDDQETFTGTPSYGISGFYGDVMGANRSITNRLRVGIDATSHLGPFTFMEELSVGQDEDSDVVNSLTEVNWVTPGENVVIYNQLVLLNREFHQGWDDTTSSVVGVRYTPDNAWALSAQYEQGWSGFSEANGEGFFSMQARYRF